MINIPNWPGIKTCSECDGHLSNSDFLCVGVACETPSKVFFDYKCRHCEFTGRWTISLVLEEAQACTPLVSLKTLVSMIDAGEMETLKQRGILVESLNKVHGVSDLFRLGGKNAPRERRAKKG